MKKLILFCLFLFSVSVNIYAQTPSVIEHIRIPLWAEVDAYPELEEAQDVLSEPYSYPIQKIREIGPFLISGMVYGWDFVYCPSDKSRGVEEYFELTEKKVSDVEIVGIEYSSPWIQDEKLNCWCEYTRTPSQIQSYYLWSSIQNPVIQGRGTGSVTSGFDGIIEAAQDSVKNAVRNHYRTKVKNKPKEIRGAVLIREAPLLGIDSGRYVLKLDFFLEYDKIIEYSTY